MADTLETLEIEVAHSATNAASEIKEVASAVHKLGNALEKVMPTLSVFQKILGKNTFNFTANTTVNNADTINQVKQSAERAQKATKEVSKEVRNLGDSAKRSTGILGNMASSLKRIAMYRILRSILKEIGQALQEGLEKAYFFSSGITGEGNRFASALDRMKSATNQMKGQLGSAFISLLTAIEPILTALIDLVTRAADAISQLISAFTGKTYLKANQTMAKFAENTKKGAGAAKEWKNQLLGFDEINRLNEPSSGGGGSSTNPLEGYKFEDADIAEKWLTIAGTLKELFSTLKQSAKELWDSVKVAFDWNDIFKNAMKILTGLVQFVSGAFSGDWAKAFEGASIVLEGFYGITEQIMTRVQGLFVNFANWIITITSSLFDWLLASIDNVGAWIGNKLGVDLSRITDIVKGIVTDLKTLVVGVLTIVRDTISSLIDNAKQVFHGLIEFIAGVFTNDWARAWNGIKEIFKGIIQGVVNVFYGVINACIAAINSAANIVGKIIQMLGGDGFSINIGYLSPPQVFAEGGFPEDGLFYANHNELVGQFSNGRTAVANNEQITEGIRQAVYDAMTAAGNNNSNGTQFKLYLDSKEIKYGLQRVDRAWGV